MRNWFWLCLVCVSPLWAADVPPNLPKRPPAKSGPAPLPGEAPKYVYVTAKPLDIPIIQNGKLLGYIGMTATFEMTSEEMATKLSEMTVQVRNKMIKDLWAAFYILWRPGFMSNEQVIKSLMMHSIASLVGEGHVEQIFLKDFYYRKKPS